MVNLAKFHHFGQKSKIPEKCTNRIWGILWYDMVYFMVKDPTLAPLGPFGTIFRTFGPFFDGIYGKNGEGVKIPKF